MTGTEFSNPPNVWYAFFPAMVLGIMISVAGVVVAVIIQDPTGISILLILLLVAVETLFILGGWKTEYRDKPYLIRVEEEGVVMVFRRRPPERLLWDGILWYNLGDEMVGLSARFNRGGLLKSNQGRTYSLPNEVVLVVLDKLKERGRTLPAKEGYFSAKG